MVFCFKPRLHVNTPICKFLFDWVLEDIQWPSSGLLGQDLGDKSHLRQKNQQWVERKLALNKGIKDHGKPEKNSGVERRRG